jgi:lipid-binding SYLF domain-containing protein
VLCHSLIFRFCLNRDWSILAQFAAADAAATKIQLVTNASLVEQLMKIRAIMFGVVCSLLCSSRILSPALGQPVFFVSEEEHVVVAARTVLREITVTPEKAIPRAMLSRASGIAIIPNVVKGGFVVGLRHGRGVVLLRDEQGAWTPPQFITLTGGSIGWQAGIQSTDLILVFKTPNSIRGLLNGKLTIGADAAAAAGPVGRNAALATDAQLRAEIYSYSRSRGLFAGIALDGSSLQIDSLSGARYYQQAAAVAGNVGAAAKPIPASALALIQDVAALTLPGPPAVSRAVPAVASAPTLEQIRAQLVPASAQLQAILDSHWQTYLVLPSDVMAPGPMTNVASAEQLLARFDSVAADPQYAAISGRVEFQTAHQLLRQFLAAAKSTVALPPPPQR